MAADGEDLEWLSDYVISVLKSPTWVLPMAQFMDERCGAFDDSEENKLEYTTCHNDFRQLVCDLFTSHLLEVSVTPEQFSKFCQSGLTENSQLHHSLVEQLLSVDDYLTFKAMMAKQNADLDREAVMTFEDEEDDPGSPTAHVVNSLLRETIGQTTDDWQFYEDQELKAAIAASQADFEGKQEADRRCEEAELEQAIALSLQLEEERLRQLDLQADSQAPAPPTEHLLPPTAGFTSAPLAHVIRPKVDPVVPHLLRVGAIDPSSTPVPASAGFTSAPLTRLVRRPSKDPPEQADVAPPCPPPPEAPEDAPAPEYIAPELSAPGTLPPLKQKAADLEAYRISLHQYRQRAERALAAHPPPVAPPVMAGPAPPSGPTEEERRQRAEHLRRQRDRLLQKRTREREQKLAEFHRGRTAQRAALGTVTLGSEERSLSMEERAAEGRRLVAELTPGVVVASAAAPHLPNPSVAAEQMRQALTLQLRQSLVRSAVDGAAPSSLGDRLGQLECLRQR